MFLKLKKSSKVSKLMNAILLSKSTKPLSKIEETKNVFCFGKFPIIVSTPDDDIIVILSPISKSRLKLNSLPIEIEFFSISSPQSLIDPSLGVKPNNGIK